MRFISIAAGRIIICLLRVTQKVRSLSQLAENQIRVYSIEFRPDALSVSLSALFFAAGKMPQAMVARTMLDSQKGAIPLIKKQQTPLENNLRASTHNASAKKNSAVVSARQHAITRSDLIKNALLAATQEARFPRQLCEKAAGSMETEM